MRSLLERFFSAVGLPDSADAAGAVAPCFEPRRVAKGEVLLHQGGLWGRAWLIEHGLLRMHLVGHDGKAFNKSFHLEGALVCPLTPEMEAAPSLFAISALEASVVWQAPMPALRAGLHAAGAWEPLRSALLARLVNQKLQREHDLLALDGSARYHQLCTTRADLAARVPLAHLASYLGLTDVSLSRIRRQRKLATG